MAKQLSPVPRECVSLWAAMFENHSDQEVFQAVAQWGYDQCLNNFEYFMSDVIPPSPDIFQPESELVIRVGKKLGGDDYNFNPEAWEDTARVAIREVADWIKGHIELVTSNHLVAEDLVSETNK
jgi:hypothetical protein